MISWTSQLTDSDLAEHYNYQLSDPAKKVGLLQLNNANQFLAPVLDYYTKKFYNSGKKVQTYPSHAYAYGFGAVAFIVAAAAYLYLYLYNSGN